MVKNYGEMIQVECKKRGRTFGEYLENKTKVFSSFFAQDIHDIGLCECEDLIANRKYWLLMIRLKEDVLPDEKSVSDDNLEEAFGEFGKRIYYHAELNDSDADRVREWMSDNSALLAPSHIGN